jgi:zinc protease
MINRTIAPQLQLIDEVNLQKPEVFKLDNGVEAYLMKGGSFEILKFELLFKSGTYHQDKPLQAYSTANLLRKGTFNRSQEQISNLWDFYGVSLQIEAQKDIISVGFYCLTRHLDPVLELLIEIVSQAIFPQQELENLLRNKYQQHVVNHKKVNHVARINFNEMLFGEGHPYGKRLHEHDFKNIHIDDVKEYHGRFINPANCVCLVSGHFPEDIISIINRKFDMFPWPEAQAADDNLLAEPAAPTGKHFIAMPDAVQSSVRIGKIMIHRNHPHHHLASVTNTLLGGYFGSRLMRNIRQEKGYTYGISSSMVALVRETYFFISTQVGNEVREAAIEEIYKEIKDLREKRAGSLELDMLKNHLTASFLRSFDGPFMQMERFRELLLFNLDYSYYEGYLPLLNNIAPSDIQEIAEQFFHEDDMLELVVG